MDHSQDNLQLHVFPREHAGVMLRPMMLEDAEDLLPLLSAPGVYEGLVSIPRNPDIDFARSRTKDICDNMAEGKGLQLIAQLHGTIVGTIGIRINWKHRHGGLGYHLDEHARGKGVASRMLQGMAEHCFEQLKLHRIWAETFLDNEPSRQLLKRNGFIFEGVKRAAYLKEEHFRDVDMWALTADDPRPW
ncbi:MAG: GNAT family N-acetyltransferase [Phycisphaerales bacterium]|nr:GNAT family N-acetyltransferase [Phycisphaerales bacterium]